MGLHPVPRDLVVGVRCIQQVVYPAEHFLHVAKGFGVGAVGVVVVGYEEFAYTLLAA